MDWIVRAIGVLYLVSAAFLVRSMAVEMVAMAGRGATVRNPLAHYWPRLRAALIVASGLALALLSPLTIPVLTLALAVQAGWLVYLKRHVPARDEDDAFDRQKLARFTLAFAAVTLAVTVLLLTGMIAYNGGPVTSKWVPVGFLLPVIGGVGVFLGMLVA